MAQTTRSSYPDMIPELFAEAVQKGFPGLKALNGSPAAIIDTSLNSSLDGDTVVVPYFNAIGDFAQINEGAAITPTEYTGAAEKADVHRYGLGFDMTRWARMAVVDEPYAHAAALMREAMQRKIDSELISTAVANLTAAETLDLTGGATAADQALSWEALCNARALFGDEQLEDLTLFVHSNQYFKLLKLTGSDGHPLFVDAQEGGIARLAGMHVVVSDRLPVASGTYTSLICKPGSLVAWINGNVGIEVEHSAAKHSDEAYMNFYMATHRYVALPGLSKGGVVQIKSK